MSGRIASETVGQCGEDEMTDHDSSVLNAEPGVPAAPSVDRLQVEGGYVRQAQGDIVGMFSSHWAAVAAMIRVHQPEFRSLGGDRAGDLAEEARMRRRLMPQPERVSDRTAPNTDEHKLPGDTAGERGEMPDDEPDRNAGSPYLDKPNRELYEAALVSAIVTDDALFQLLIEKWHKERGATSSITEMAICRSHLSIVAMGEKAIPLILRQMASEGDEPDMWFVALQMLTRADPVTDDIRGDFKAMADRWLQWAADKGYAW